MSDTTYNGWTNYATWRVNLELIDGSDWHCYFDSPPAAYTLGQGIKSWAEEFIEQTTQEGIGRDYALAFLSDVNWREIAQHLIDNYVDA
jgi:hypothetical protein